VTVRVKIPLHLQRLTRIDGNELSVEVIGEATQTSVFDALEKAYPVLVGTVRDSQTGRRRALLRIFACGQDLSHDDPGKLLPEAVASGKEPFMIVGAIAGG
jgi:molybdopterin synthase sulfur carrier subunit